jgi:prepilin-type N-terminal cleavage/methylation domain-containing protein
MSHQKAFTLIEMLVVVMIIGILSSFVFIQINSSINEGKDVKRKADIELLANAVVSYSSDHYSSKPITDFDGCQIGVDCGTEIENSLKAYLPTLPNDPNSDAVYVYQSNGNDCTISATLSDNTVYQYSCTNDAITTGTPVTGVCGSAANTYDPGTTTFTGDFCASGNTNPTTPVFPSVDGTTVSWECSGEYLGDSTTCTAYRGADGVCGTVTTTTATAYLPSVNTWPSSNYCSVGTTTTPSFPLEGGSTNWSCAPIYAGDTASCIAYRGQNGVCGTSTGDNYYLSTEINNPCSTGTVSTITTSLPATNYFKWTCSGIYTGSSSPQCTANLKVNGACGSANGGTYASVPGASVRCANGTTPTNTTNWTWGCNGLNGGTNTGGTILPTAAVATCSATYGAYGVCSTTAGVCTTGTATSTYLCNELYWCWSCSGVGSLTGTSASCSAPIPLTGGVHYSTQCSGLGAWFCTPPALGYCNYNTCMKQCGDNYSYAACKQAIVSQGWTCVDAGFSYNVWCY